MIKCFTATLLDGINMEYALHFHGNTESALVVGQAQRKQDVILRCSLKHAVNVEVQKML